MAEFNAKIEENLRNRGVVIAGGMDIYKPDVDTSYNDVFRRADKNMYQRKVELKQSVSA